MESNIQKIVNENKLFMNDVPSWAKIKFLKRALTEFNDHYGNCLSQMIKECEEYGRLKEMFFNSNIDLLTLSKLIVSAESSNKLK